MLNRPGAYELRRLLKLNPPTAADLVGFTQLCSRVPAMYIVRVLNQMFTRRAAAAVRRVSRPWSGYLPGVVIT